MPWRLSFGDAEIAPGQWRNRPELRSVCPDVPKRSRWPVSARFFLDWSLSGRACPIRPLQWLDLTEGRLRLDRLCRNVARRLSSPGGPPHAKDRAGTPARPFLARQETLRADILRCAAARKRVRRRSPPVCRSPSRPRWARAREQRTRRTTMANIGTFKKAGADYLGELVFLSVSESVRKIS